MSGEVRKLLLKAVEELRDAQSSEGKKLRKLIENRCGKIEKLVRKYRDRTPELRQLARVRMAERLESIQVQVDAERLEKEVALLLLRHDISEELDRLEAHLAALRSALTSGEPAGKRVSFLLQEIGRETNTLAAKSGDARGTHEAVDMRVLVEQMREQAQNIL